MDPLKTRLLGRTGLEVTQLGFGGAQLEEYDRRIPEAKAQGAIGAAYEAGINFWDTSPYYGHGLSEHRLGYYLREQPRDSFILQTKVGRVFSRSASDPMNVDVSPWIGGLPFIFRFDIDVFLVAMPYSLIDQTGLDRELAICSEHNIGIIKGAPYASGVLATGPESDSTFNYTPTPLPVLDKVRRIQLVCDRHGVHLRAAAIQFLLGHESAATVIPGMTSKWEVLDNLAMLEADIPPDFWLDLKADGLLRADAPT